MAATLPAESSASSGPLGVVGHELGTLVRQEAQLARTEAAVILDRVRGGLILAAVAVVLAMPLVGVLTAALVLAIEQYWLTDRPALAALVAAALLAAVAIPCALAARRRLGGGALIPHRTLASLREDFAWLHHPTRHTTKHASAN